LSFTGAITNCTISPTSFGSGEAYISFTYNDLGYEPVIIATPQNDVNNTTIPNMTPLTLTYVTSNSAQFLVRETTSTTQNLIIHVMILDPNLNYGPY
jgi:hypothetical protein